MSRFALLACGLMAVGAPLSFAAMTDEAGNAPADAASITRHGSRERFLGGLPRAEESSSCAITVAPFYCRRSSTMAPGRDEFHLHDL